MGVVSGDGNCILDKSGNDPVLLGTGRGTGHGAGYMLQLLSK